jgi:hypothetical protein
MTKRRKWEGDGNVDIRSAEQALRESKRLKSYWSVESRLTQRILIYVAELLERQARPKRRNVATRWQRFAAKAVKDGKTLKQAAAEWNLSKP